MVTEIFRLENVTKTKNHFPVLEDLNLTIRKGEIMGLLSLNDEGKSSLTDILCGQTSIDHGRIYYNDVLIDLDNENPPFAGRVVSVENKTKLTPALSVADNIFVIRKGFGKYIVNKRVLRNQTARTFSEFGVDIDPKSSVISLTQLERGIVELMKAYATGARLVILSNLSSYLSTFDLNRFHQIVFLLKEKGLSFLYIDNDFEVSLKICDRLFIMREGKNIRTFPKGECDEKTALSLLLGRDDDVWNLRPFRSAKPQTLVFDKVTTHHLDQVSFTVCQGEVISILDTHGSSNDSILSLLTGGEKCREGQILLGGQDCNPHSLHQAIRSGIGLICEDPVDNNLMFDISVLDNLCMPLFEKLKGRLFKQGIRKSVRMEFTPRLGHEIDHSDLYSVSRQTLQKLVYYKWMLFSPRLLICIKPLSSLDMVGRKLTMNLIGELADKGISILILTSTFSEAYHLSDRVILIDGLKKRGEYLRGDNNLKRLMGLEESAPVE